MALQMKLEITPESDWHIGSGFGRPGDVDRLVIRDAEGLPYIPGKTIVGLWRDACETLARGLDDTNPDGGWYRWIHFLFGDQPSRDARQFRDDPSHPNVLKRLERPPRKAVLRIDSARLPGELYRLLSGKRKSARRCRESLYVVKPGVKISSRSGRAESRHLRFEERVRGGVSLSTEVRVEAELSNEQTRACQAFLAAAAGLVERLGGKRRRGAGRCRWRLSGQQLHNAVNVLNSLKSPPDIPDQSSDDHSVDAQEGRRACAKSRNVHPRWFDIPLRLELKSPIAIPSRVVGNVVESRDFVPGTYLLPHLTRVLQHLGINTDAAVQEQAIRVLPFTISVREERGVPLPLSWFAQKDKSPLCGSESTRNRILQAEQDGEPPFKQLRVGYISYDTTRKQVSGFDTVPLETRTHNTIEEASQRPTSEVGGVYSYQAIAATELRGILRIHGDIWLQLEQNSDWRELMGGIVSVGRSNKDEYGTAILSIPEFWGTDTADAREATTERESPVGFLDVLLLSDTLLQDENLQWNATVAQLRKELETRLSELTNATVQLKAVKTFARVRRIESWHSGWALPRSSLVALAAGSCARFQCNADELGAEDLRHAMRQVEGIGVGLRRVEGYGEICFQHPLIGADACVAAIRSDHERDEPEPPLVSHDSDAFVTARAVEIGCWRRLIDEEALVRAQSVSDSMRWSGLSSNQLGNLRVLVNEVRSWESRQSLKAWADHLRTVDSRVSKWREASLSRLEELFDLGSEDVSAEQAHVWRELEVDDWPVTTRRAATALKEQLWSEAIRSLMSAAIRYQQLHNQQTSVASHRVPH